MFLKSVIIDTPFIIKDYIHDRVNGQIHVGDILYHQESNSIINVLGEIDPRKKMLRTDILGHVEFASLQFVNDEHFQYSGLKINKILYYKLRYSHILGDVQLISFGFHQDSPLGNINHIMSLPCMPSQDEFENLYQIHSPNFPSDSWFEVNEYSNHNFRGIVCAKSSTSKNVQLKQIEEL
jgi:hypothetical protein